MLARDLPRIPLEKDGQETLVASLNETFGPSNWGLGFEDDDVLIQFNYIQEGEFWYDIEYPDIELPSIVAQRYKFVGKIRCAMGTDSSNHASRCR